MLPCATHTAASLTHRVQMASTAAGVAVGSTMGHGLSNMLFGGGGSSEAAPVQDAQQQQPQQGSWAQQDYAQNQQNHRMAGNCEAQSKGACLTSAA